MFPKEKGEPDSDARALVVQSKLAAIGESAVGSYGDSAGGKSGGALQVPPAGPRRALTVRAFPGAELVFLSISHSLTLPLSLSLFLSKVK